MCAGLGIERVIEELEWDGLKGFVSFTLFALLAPFLLFDADRALSIF